MAYAVFYVYIKFHSKKKKSKKQNSVLSGWRGHQGISIGGGGPHNDTKKE